MSRREKARKGPEKWFTRSRDGGAMTEEQVRTIAVEEASDNESNNTIAFLGCDSRAIGVAFGITANMRARKTAK